MELFGVGPLELLFIFIIALIVLGPNDMVKAGRTLGRWLRALVTSPAWRTIQDASRELRQLPTKMMRDSGLEDLKKELPSAAMIRKETKMDEIQASLRRDVDATKKVVEDIAKENTIAPPRIETKPAEQPAAADQEPPAEWTSAPAVIDTPEALPEDTTPSQDPEDISDWLTPPQTEEK